MWFFRTFITHLSRFRIPKAQGLLASTDRPIVEISQEVGLRSQTYFGVVFQKFDHMSPYQYRKRTTKVARQRVPARARAASSEVPIESRQAVSADAVTIRTLKSGASSKGSLLADGP